MRERVLGKGWAWHDEFVAELRRTVAPGYVWDNYPLTRWRRYQDGPLLRWRQHTRASSSSRSRPAMPGTARNHPVDQPMPGQARARLAVNGAACRGARPPAGQPSAIRISGPRDSDFPDDPPS